MTCTYTTSHAYSTNAIEEKKRKVAVETDRRYLHVLTEAINRMRDALAPHHNTPSHPPPLCADPLPSHRQTTLYIKLEPVVVIERVLKHDQALEVLLHVFQTIVLHMRDYVRVRV